MRYSIDGTQMEISGDPAKIKRILVYPNITYSKNLEQDSYVQVMKKLIFELSKIRNDLYWYIISPERIKGLQFDNVYQFITPFPTYPPTMRCHFDTFSIKEHLSKKYDFDLVFSHLPEHTWNLVNLLKNNTYHSVPVLGYSHWFDFDHIQTWQVGAFSQNMMGLLQMEKCYINTEYQKQLVLKEAEKTFNKSVIDKLDKILEPFYLGVSKEDLHPPTKSEKCIVFNHRPHAYKHFTPFLNMCTELYKTRQDFEVWIPLWDTKFSEKLKWLNTEKFDDKEGYYKKLRTCRVGFSPEQTYGGWSVATTDGLMNGCPFIMYDADYYKELNPTADFFSTDNEAITLLNKYLDDESYRNEKATESFNYVSENLLYEHSIKKLSDQIDDTISNTHGINHSKKLDRMIKYIKDKKVVTKADLIEKTGWGRGIKFSPYRKALTDHANIFDKMGMLPYYIWKDD